MFRIFIISTCLIMTQFAFSQPIISAPNRVDWSRTGFEGTIPSPSNSIWVMDAPYNAQGDGITDDGPAIQAALDAAIAGDVVFLPAGTYLTRNQLTIKDKVILRGDCSGGTILKFDLAGVAETCISVITFQYGTPVAINDGIHKGDAVLTVTDASGFSVGSFAEIRQDNDPAVMYTSEDWNVSWAVQAVGQISKVTAINGNQISIDPPLTINYNPAMSPEVRPTGLKQGVGIENLAIERLDEGDDFTIEFKNTANCWVRNIESYNTVRSHIWVSQSLHLEIRDSYFHHSFDYGGGGHGYGVTLGNHATFCLVENNIFRSLRHSMMLKQGATGNVFGYNYSIEPFWSDFEGIPTDISLHGHYPNMNLLEGNIVQEATSADYWGPSGPGNTFFRNRIETSNLKVADASHYQNLIGNELSAGDNVVEIDETVNNTLKHGNNENGRIDWENGITQDLPASYYLSDTPDFWDTAPFPNIGPEFLFDSGMIPAQKRYTNGRPNACNFLLDEIVSSSPDRKEKVDERAFRIFPNPAGQQLSIYYQLQKSQKVKIELIHPAGKLIKKVSLGQQVAGEGVWHIDLANTPSGLLFLRLIIGQREERRLIVHF